MKKTLDKVIALCYNDYSEKNRERDLHDPRFRCFHPRCPYFQLESDDVEEDV